MTTGTNKKQYLLSAAELPFALHGVYDLQSQALENWPNRKGLVLTVTRSCPECQISQRVKVSSVRDCIRLGTLTGLCKKCFSAKPTGVSRGNAHYNWKGGKRIDPKGYVHIRQPKHPHAQNGYVQEHRLVMEQSLGRLLLPSETVHHKNGIKADNQIENLELWSKSHSDGCRYDDMSIEQLEILIAFLQQKIADRR